MIPTIKGNAVETLGYLEALEMNGWEIIDERDEGHQVRYTVQRGELLRYVVLVIWEP